MRTEHAANRACSEEGTQRVGAHSSKDFKARAQVPQVSLVRVVYAYLDLVLGEELTEVTGHCSGCL